ncbi:SNF2 family N-terminal domain-containing protein [Gautieria morchelliformis]|nr:SNF2 family N-terminal domain-containing protein [Gautieria morchelliformis]
MVGPGEEVTLVREPHNTYDRNALQVMNISGTQVGHIPRNIALKLAPLMDRNLVTVEGVIHEGNLNRFEYSISITLKIYGASHRRAQLEPLLVWATPRQQGFTDAMRPASYQTQPSGSNATYALVTPPRPISTAGPSASQSATSMSASQRKAHEDHMESLRKAAELRTMLSSLEKVDDEGRRTSLLDSVCTTDDILNLPEHPSPPCVASGELTVNLLRHQSQALQWCLERENPSLPQHESDRPVQFWQLKLAPGRSKVYYLNLATKTPQETRPVLGKGGLMADAMGLGKTLTMLALILATKKDTPSDFSNTTLIVVPLSVLSNWKTQIAEHCASGAITSHVYYDSGRNLAPQDLPEFDVVITTYQVVTQDHSSSNGIVTKMEADGKAKKKRKSKGGLFDVKWKRIILDEGHTIRNSKTKMATAVRALNAQRRWVVTGTPIINSPKDLGSLLQFLQICRPLDNEDYYKRLLLRPIAQGSPEGGELLKALMSHICIRRTKEMQNSEGEHLVPLPPVEMTLIPVQLDTDTRELYDEVELLSKERFASYMARQGVSDGRSMPTNVLSLLTRLRQLTLHPGLIPGDYVEQLRCMGETPDKPAPAIPITSGDRIRLAALLARAIEDREECPICFDITSDPRITPCAHIFCLACISEVISRDAKCPMDRRIINMSDLIEPPPPADFTQAPPPPEPDEDTSGIRTGSSAKIDQLVHLLQLTPKTEKSLVFSQFTGFLNKIAEALDEKGIPYVRFDGQMSARRRQEVLERFSIPLEVKNTLSLPKRSRRSTAKIIMDSDADDYDAQGPQDPQDPDFVLKNEDDDDLFLGDSNDEDTPWTAKKGKGKAKPKSKAKRRGQIDAFSDYRNPVVMLISLKAGALGLNLTVANNVYLMDPWWQEGIESQAIDRCNRIGQTKPVHVYQLVAENTVEAKVLEIQERKKNLIKQAFSGIKSTETQREKKQARLQDLVELFGIRASAAP